MKNIFMASGLALVMLGCLFTDATAQEVVAVKPDHVTVYYFYTSARCMNCHNMEKWTKEVMDESFADPIGDGSLELRVINLDVKGNEHYAVEYQLFTKSIIVSIVKNGKETKYANLTKIWDCLSSGKKFKDYVKEEIVKSLKELR